MNDKCYCWKTVDGSRWLTCPHCLEGDEEE